MVSPSQFFPTPKKVVIEGVEIAIGDGPEEITWEELWEFLKDWEEVKGMPDYYD